MRTPISPGGSPEAFNTASSTAGAAIQGDAATGTSPNQSSAAYGNPGALPYQTQLLSNLATIEHSTGPEIVNHYNVQPVFDVYANIDRRDLGGVASDVEKIIAKTKMPRAPRRSSCAARQPPCRVRSIGSAWGSWRPSFWYTF